MKKLIGTFFGILIFFQFFSQRRIDLSPNAGAPPNYVSTLSSGLPVCNDLSDDLFLSWSDEFNGTTLDLNRWKIGWHWGLTYGLGSCWADANEIHFTGNSIKLGVNSNSAYVPGNGGMVLRNYSVGVISTEELYGYGYYETRCKIPYISKHHPAFWLYGGCSQEIDVFEFVGIAEPPIQSTNSPPWKDKLGICNPHRNYWYMPAECAAADPIMTYHSPIDAGCNYPVSNGRRDLGRTLIYSEWDVNPTLSDPNVGCVYKSTIDMDFQNEWHTFGMKFSPEGIFWYIDNIQVVAEYRFFTSAVVNNHTFYIPIVDLKNFCKNNSSTTIYEQVNLPTDKIKMSVILENYRDPDIWMNGYNLFDFINNWYNWPDGFLEVDYVRYYKFSECNKDLDFCYNSQLDLYNNSVKARNITFNANCLINVPGSRNLDLKALEEVKILSEFSMDNTSEFSAEIKNCSDGAIQRHAIATIDSTALKVFNPDFYKENTRKTIESILYSDVFIYPSPNKGKFDIKTDNGFEKKCYLVNNLGEILYQTSFSKEILNLDLQLPDGIYTLIIINKGVTSQHKIVVTN